MADDGEPQPLAHLQWFPIRPPNYVGVIPAPWLVAVLPAVLLEVLQQCCSVPLLLLGHLGKFVGGQRSKLVVRGTIGFYKLQNTDLLF